MLRWDNYFKYFFVIELLNCFQISSDDETFSESFKSLSKIHHSYEREGEEIRITLECGGDHKLWKKRVIEIHILSSIESRARWSSRDGMEESFFIQCCDIVQSCEVFVWVNWRDRDEDMKYWSRKCNRNCLESFI